MDRRWSQVEEEGRGGEGGEIREPILPNKDLKHINLILCLFPLFSARFALFFLSFPLSIFNRTQNTIEFSTITPLSRAGWIGGGVSDWKGGVSKKLRSDLCILCILCLLLLLCMGEKFSSSAKCTRDAQK